MREFAHRIVHPRPFEYLLVVLIVGSAVWLGMATYAPVLDRYAVGMGLFWLLTLVVLTLEVLLKMVALLPRIDRYFRDGWNVFDFLVVGALIIGGAIDSATDSTIADYATIILLLSLLRLLQGLATVEEMRLILLTLLRSIPERGTRRDPAGHRPLCVCGGRARHARRRRPGKLGQSGRGPPVAVSDSDVGRLGQHHAPGPRVTAVGAGLFRQLCGHQCLYHNQLLHRHHH